jgi:hypothetical protein
MYAIIPVALSSTLRPQRLRSPGGMITAVAQDGVLTIRRIFGAWHDKSVQTDRAVPSHTGLL